MSFIFFAIVCRFAFVRYVVRLSPRSESSAETDDVLVSKRVKRSSFCHKYIDFFTAPIVIFSYTVVGFILNQPNFAV